MLYLHKNGITFRKADRSDLNFLQNMKAETWWGTHGVAIINNDDQERWLEHLPSDCLVLIGEVPIDKDVIAQQYLGFCIISDIDWIARTASISGAVQKRLRSPELSQQAFEAGLDFAFEMLNLHRLNAEVAEYNYPARKIEIGDLGFAVEGVRRQAIYKCGRYYNSLVLGMLRTEWESHPRVRSMEGSCCTNFSHELSDRMITRANRQPKGLYSFPL